MYLYDLINDTQEAKVIYQKFRIKKYIYISFPSNSRIVITYPTGIKNNLRKKKRERKRSFAAFELIDQSISPRRTIAKKKKKVKEREKMEIILEVGTGLAEGHRMIDATFKRPCHASNGIIQFKPSRY